MNSNRSQDVCGCTFVYNGTTISYDLIFSARRSRAIVIKGERIVVKLPVGDYEVNGHELLKNRADWVLKALERNRTRAAAKPSTACYQDGTQHLFLGKQYTLQVVKDTQNSVEIVEDKIILKSKNITEKGVKQLLMKWYHAKADKIFAEIAAPLVSWFGAKYNRYPTHFENKFVKGYWGQCRYDGLIRLNIELVKAEPSLIQYVITHELCHLIHRNHSKEYYQLLASIMCDWKERKEKLNLSVAIER